MNHSLIIKAMRLAAVGAAILMLQGCVGMVVGAAVDATIEVAKVPFKVGKAAVDLVTADDKKQSESKK